MTVLSANRETDRKEAVLIDFPVVASEIIYKGALTALDADGYLTAAADAANLRVCGVAMEKIDNSSGSSGDVSCGVFRTGAFLFVATSITQAMVNQIMYVVDDQTFDDTTGTYAIVAGRLVSFVSTTSGWIDVEEGWTHGVGVLKADADGTYSSNEQDLINEIKDKLNL